MGSCLYLNLLATERKYKQKFLKDMHDLLCPGVLQLSFSHPFYILASFFNSWTKRLRRTLSV